MKLAVVEQVERMTTPLRQQLWVDQAAEIGHVAEWKSELCAVTGAQQKWSLPKS